MSHARRISTLDESSRKRKERDTLYSSPKPSFQVTAVNKANVGFTTTYSKRDSQTPNSSPRPSPNPLLAGYMAYEFLTRGTLMGQKFDPASRAKAVVPVPVPVLNTSAESKKTRRPSQAEAAAEPSEKRSYAEVASLLRSDGAHIAGVVNPTQLARWIRM